MASDDLRARIAEALCPSHHRVGSVSSGRPLAPLSPCQLHQAQADTVVAVIQPDLDRLTAEAEQDRRALIEQPVLRHCVYPGCLREFDVSAALSGRPTRDSWSGKGWLQVRTLNSNICPDHAPVVGEDAHRPQWRHGDGPSVLVCACGWESVPVRWRGYGIEAWKDHVLTSNEETPS